MVSRSCDRILVVAATQGQTIDFCPLARNNLFQKLYFFAFLGLSQGVNLMVDTYNWSVVAFFLLEN